MLSGEIALKNNHYYYYCFLTRIVAATLVFALFCQGLASETHCCLVLVMIWHPIYNKFRILQLK